MTDPSIEFGGTDGSMTEGQTDQEERQTGKQSIEKQKKKHAKKGISIKSQSVPPSSIF